MCCYDILFYHCVYRYSDRHAPVSMTTGTNDEPPNHIISEVTDAHTLVPRTTTSSTMSNQRASARHDLPLIMPTPCKTALIAYNPRSFGKHAFTALPAPRKPRLAAPGMYDLFLPAGCTEVLDGEKSDGPGMSASVERIIDDVEQKLHMVELNLAQEHDRAAAPIHNDNDTTVMHVTAATTAAATPAQAQSRKQSRSVSPSRKSSVPSDIAAIRMHIPQTTSIHDRTEDEVAHANATAILLPSSSLDPHHRASIASNNADAGDTDEASDYQEAVMMKRHPLKRDQPIIVTRKQQHHGGQIHARAPLSEDMKRRARAIAQKVLYGRDVATSMPSLNGGRSGRSMAGSSLRSLDSLASNVSCKSTRSVQLRTEANRRKREDSERTEWRTARTRIHGG